MLNVLLLLHPKWQETLLSYEKKD